MRRCVIAGAVALGMTVAEGALAQEPLAQEPWPHCHSSCKWDLIIRYPADASQDLYPGGDSREECERMIEQVRAVHADSSAEEMTCVDTSRPDTWPHLPDPPPSSH
jgi:hypothetical protein